MEDTEIRILKASLQSDLVSQQNYLSHIKAIATTTQSNPPGIPHTLGDSNESVNNLCRSVIAKHEHRFKVFKVMISKCKSKADTDAAEAYSKETFTMLKSDHNTVQGPIKRMIELQEQRLNGSLLQFGLAAQQGYLDSLEAIATSTKSPPHPNPFCQTLAKIEGAMEDTEIRILKASLQSDLVSQQNYLCDIKKIAMTTESHPPGIPHTLGDSYDSMYNLCLSVINKHEERFKVFKAMISKCNSKADTRAAEAYSKETFTLLTSDLKAVQGPIKRMIELQEQRLNGSLLQFDLATQQGYLDSLEAIATITKSPPLANPFCQTLAKIEGMEDTEIRILKASLQSDLVSQKNYLSHIKAIATTTQSNPPGIPHTFGDSYESVNNLCRSVIAKHEHRFKVFKVMISKCKSKADTDAAEAYSKETFTMLNSDHNTVQGAFTGLSQLQEQRLNVQFSEEGYDSGYDDA